jgi:hypothetical protein
MFVLVLWSVVVAFSAKEPPQLWTALANHPALEKSCRRDCVLRLFQCRVRRGMRLSELARLLDSPTWLGEDDATQFIVLGGFVPVNWTLDTSLYSLHIFPELGKEAGVVYLVVSGRTDYKGGKELTHLLRGVGGETLRDRVILDICCLVPELEKHSRALPSEQRPVASRAGSRHRPRLHSHLPRAGWPR